MKQFAEKLIKRNYTKRIVAVLLAAVVLMAAVAVLVPVTLHKQIEELRVWEKAQEEQERMGETAADGMGRSEPCKEEKHDDRERELKAVLRQITPIGREIKIAFVVVAFLAFVLFVFYWLTVAEWLYKMATLHGLNRALWPMLGLLFNVLVIPALLIVICNPKRLEKQVS